MVWAKRATLSHCVLSEALYCVQFITCKVSECADNVNFHSKAYGNCILEHYTMKSYIRNWNKITGKKSLIIGSEHKTLHVAVCKALVPAVQAGHNKDSLKDLRKHLLQQFA